MVRFRGMRLLLLCWLPMAVLAGGAGRSFVDTAGQFEQADGAGFSTLAMTAGEEEVGAFTSGFRALSRAVAKG